MPNKNIDEDNLLQLCQTIEEQLVRDMQDVKIALNDIMEAEEGLEVLGEELGEEETEIEKLSDIVKRYGIDGKFPEHYEKAEKAIVQIRRQLSTVVDDLEEASKACNEAFELSKEVHGELEQVT